MDQVERKETDIRKALNYNYNEEDVNYMVQEKKRFLKGPVNYAMRKSDLIKAKEVAEQNGDMQEVQRLQIQMDELEQKASDLDHRRSENIAGISWINQKNRNFMKDTVLNSHLRMEKPMEDDPFTRKNQRMKVAASGRDRSAAQDELMAGTSRMREETRTIVQTTTHLNVPTRGLNIANSNSPMNKPADDLFSAHNFDMEIDINLPGGRNFSSAMTSTAASLTEISRPLPSTSQRSSLTLDDYRKRRGML